MIVYEYDPNWPQEFERLKAVYLQTLDNLIITVEHVGSTSIPGLKAKPTIDMDMVIKDYDIFPAVVEKLADLGYVHNGDQGIQHREAFKRDDATIPYTEPKRTWLTHHLYVCPTYSEELKRHLLLRDYLRINDKARDAYASIKDDIVARSKDDRPTYVAIKEDEYNDFFENMLLEAKDYFDKNQT